MAINIKGGLFTQNDVRETVTNTQEASVLFNLDYARYVSEISSAQPVLGVCFCHIGCKMYIAYEDAVNGGTIAEWTFGTFWDISTATETYTLTVNATDGDPRGMYLSPDGTKLYWVGHSSELVYQYNLSTPFDLSTAAASGNTINPSGSNISGLFFREDGKECYVGQDVGMAIYTFSLTTAWDLSTATEISDDAMGVNTNSIYISRDGLSLFTAYGVGKVQISPLAVPYLMSSVTGNSDWIMTPDGNCHAMWFKTNGSVLYCATEDTEKIQQYHIHRKWR